MSNIIKYSILTFICFFSFSNYSFANGNMQSYLLKAANSKANGAYVRRLFTQLQNKSFTNSRKKKLLIIGDSHAQDFLNSMHENGYLAHYQTRTLYVYTRCQISFSEYHVPAKDKNFCRRSNNLKLAHKQIKKADVIIFAANWTEWAAKHLPETIQNLRLRADQKYIVIGRKNFGKINVRRYLNMDRNELRTLKNTADSNQLRINKLMQRSLGAGVFVNQHRLICGSTVKCPIFTPTLKLISFDGGHLTKDGARYVGQLLFRHPAFRRL